MHRSSSTGAGVSNGAREKGYDAPAVVLIVGLLLSVSRKPALGAAKRACERDGFVVAATNLTNPMRCCICHGRLSFDVPADRERWMSKPANHLSSNMTGKMLSMR